MLNNLTAGEENIQPIKDTHIRLTHLGKGVAFPPHWHLEMEVMLPYEDRSKVVCGGKFVTLEKNDLLFIAPGVLHSICPSKGARDYFLAHCFMIRGLNIVEMALSQMNPYLHVSPSICPSLYNSIRQCMDEIMTLCERSPAANEAFIYAKLLEIFNIITVNMRCRNPEDTGSEQVWEKNHESMIEACKYINGHFNQKITLEDVADHVGFSKYHFSRLFHEFTGQTYYNYLTHMRISFATQMLAVQDMSISDIAYQAGFSSPTAFSRAFKKITGSTPSEYRESFT